MAVVVADLVAKLRVDNSELQTGVQAATQQLKGVQQQAELTQRALEIMAAAAARTGGGSAAGWMDIYQRSGAQPTQAALAQATLEAQKTTAAHQESAKAAEKTGAAVQQAVVHTRTAAVAAEEVSKGWNASESSIVRFASALVGVNLGISLIAGAGRMLHGIIMDTATAQIVWEQSLMRTSALYGSLGGSVVAVSQAQAQAPGMEGGQQEFLSANLNARYLGSRFGVSQASIYGLTSAAGRVSSAFGYDAAAREDLQARMLAFTEVGGSGLRNITGTEGDPLSIARRLGGVSGGQLAALTPGQLREAQAQIATLDANQTALRGAADVRGLVQIQAEKEKMLSQAQDALQNSIEGIRPAGMALGPAGAPERRMLPSLLPSGTPAMGGGFTLEAPSVLTNAVREAQKAFDDAKQAVIGTTTALAENKAALEKMGITYGTATFRLLGFTGNPEDPRSIARGDIASQAQQAVADRARSALATFAMPAAEIAALATNDAWQQAKQNFVAQQAQQQQDNGIKEWLQGQGPGGAAAIADAERRVRANDALRAANTANDLAGLLVAEKQSDIEAISLQYRERALNVEKETIGLRRTETQISLDNLKTTETLIQAQQRALPSGIALANLGYEQQLNVAVAMQKQAGIIRGEDVSGLPSWDELITRGQTLTLDQAKMTPAALRAQHEVDVAGYAATAGGLAAGAAQIPLTRASLNLGLAQYADDPARLAAELGLTGAQGTALSTGVAVRASTVNLSNASLTVNVSGTVRLADDAIKAAAQAAYDQVEQALRDGIVESDQGAPPVSPDLVGARHQ